MYKITLYDYNCNPITDGVTFWFVENLKSFEMDWIPLQVEHNVSTIERYFRSKAGEIVTDYYSDDPSLNIVQTEGSEILESKDYDYKDKVVKLTNVYGCEANVGFNELKTRLRILKYGNKYYLIGQYEGKGCYRIEKKWNRWYEKETDYQQMFFFGNPVAEYVHREVDWDKRKDPDAYKDFYTNDKDFFKDEEIKTFVWLPIKEVDKDFKIKELTDEEISILLRDIVGEAG